MTAIPSLCDRLDIPEAGPLAIFAATEGEALVELHLRWGDAALAALAEEPPPATDLLREVRRQLREYFAGERRAFSVPLAPRGTEFERQVWRELVTIPFGETRSYAQVAQSIGRPAACRAVGRANGRNPIPIIIPCHRVIGSDGSLTGYGGGLPVKRFLLDLEMGGAPARSALGSQMGLPLEGPNRPADTPNPASLYGIVQP
jgi:methylated-DNA-[protein]-cysteine S-methyltransferase